MIKTLKFAYISRLHSAAIDKERHGFSRVIGTRRRGVAAMIGGDDDDILIIESAYQFAEAFVECVEAGGISLHVIAMAVKHVCLYEVCKDEPVAPFAIGKHSLPHLFVCVSAQIHRDASAAKNVVDFADCRHLFALFAKGVKQRLAKRRDAVRLGLIK